MEIKATKPVLPNFEEYVKEISTIWNTGIMTNNGEKVRTFKSALQNYLDCPNLDLFVNGHSALYLAIKTMNLEGEVITSPFTFVSTTNAIIQNGLIPVFGDIDDTYNLNPDCIEELITEKTCAIITPHIFGIPGNINGIQKIADKYHLKVIYDGAQAFGTKVDGKHIGQFGDATMFSFHAIKVFNSIEGGMLVYRDPELRIRLEKERNFGIEYNSLEGDNDVVACGINAKMNEFQAAMGIVNLREIDIEIEKRKELAQNYIEQLNDIKGISTYNYEKNIDYNFAYFPIKIDGEYGMSRDELWCRLGEKGIGTRKLYNKLTCEYSHYKDKNYNRKTRHADEVKKIALDLPLYGSMTEEEINYICENIKELRGK